MKLFWIGFAIGILAGVFILGLVMKKKPVVADEAGTLTCNEEGKLVFKFSKPFGWMALKDEVIFKIGQELKDAVKDASAEK